MDEALNVRGLAQRGDVVDIDPDRKREKERKEGRKMKRRKTGESFFPSIL